MLARLLALVRVVFRTAGRTAFQRAAPLYLAIAIVSAIVFAPNAMMASDVTDLLAQSRPFRAVLWFVWLLAAMPAARAALCEPSLFALRALPIPRHEFCLAHGLLLLLVELPWVTLFARGVGLAMGLSVALTAMSVHCLLTARARSVLAVSVLVALGFAVLLPLPTVIWIPLALLAVRISLVYGFLAAPERSASAQKSWIPWTHSPALLALAVAYLVTLWRGHASLWLRAGCLLLLGVAISYLALHNNQLHLSSERGAVSMGVASVTLLLGLTGVAGPVVRSERQADWLLSVCRISGMQRALAVALAVALCGLLLGLVHGLLLGWFLNGNSRLLLRLSAATSGAGLLLGVIASSTIRWAQRGTEKDSDRILIALLVLLPIVGVLAWMFHELALLFHLVIAVWLLLRAEQATNPTGRWQRLQREREHGELS